MLSSLGATDRNVRLVMVANGAVVGVVGALIGAVIGLGAWIVYAPHLATTADHRVTWTDQPWWLIATAMVLAVVTATLASRRPARTIAQVPVIAALSGRPAPPKSVHRSAYPGIVLLGVGTVFLALSGGVGRGLGVEVPVGLLASMAGLLLLAPLALEVLGVKASGAPIAVRIALRDLSRYRARSGSALAATSLAVLIAMLITLVATGRYADVLDYFGPNLPSNQLIVYAPGNGPGSGGITPTAPGAKRATALHNSLNTITAALNSHDVVALETSANVAVNGNSTSVYIATPALLRHYGIRASAIDPTTLLVTSRSGLGSARGLTLLYGNLQAFNQNVQTVMSPKLQTLSRLPTDTSDPNLLITPYAIHKFKLPVSSAGWLIETPRALTSLQINTARQTAAAAGMTIETKSGDPSLDELRNDATAAGILLALGVLAMTVGLIRNETEGDLRTLTAVGANRRIRRTLTATTAGAVGLLGALLGTAVAYLDAAVFFGSQLGQRMSHVPVLDLLLVLVGLPVAAAAGGWLFAGREPPAIAHQPLE
jgi:putative ABC transport system permease protein